MASDSVFKANSVDPMLTVSRFTSRKKKLKTLLGERHQTLFTELFERKKEENVQDIFSGIFKSKMRFIIICTTFFFFGKSGFCKLPTQTSITTLQLCEIKTFPVNEIQYQTFHTHARAHKSFYHEKL